MFYLIPLCIIIIRSLSKIKKNVIVYYVIIFFFVFSVDGGGVALLKSSKLVYQCITITKRLENTVLGHDLQLQYKFIFRMETPLFFFELIKRNDCY